MAHAFDPEEGSARGGKPRNRRRTAALSSLNERRLGKRRTTCDEPVPRPDRRHAGRDRHARAGRRPRRVRAQPAQDGRLRRRARHPRCGRTRRRTSARPSRACRSPPAPSASAARRSAKPRRSCAAACRTCSSATRWSATQKLRRLAALAHEADVALCFDAAEPVAAASRAATRGGRRPRRAGRDRRRHAAMRRRRPGGGGGARATDRRGAGARLPRPAGVSRQRAAPRRPGASARAAIDAPRAIVQRDASTRCARRGLECALVSGAGTGTFRMEGTSGLWNELQAGSYLFMDTEYARIGGERGGALRRVRAQPVRAGDGDEHARRRDRAIVDAGLKSYSAEKGFPWVHGRRGPRGHRRVRRARQGQRRPGRARRRSSANS